MISRYGIDGKELDESDTQSKVLASKIKDEMGSTFQVLTLHGGLFDPVKKEHTKEMSTGFRCKFRTVTETIFEGYLSYLSGREQRKIRQLERM